MQHDYFFINALRMNTARSRLQLRLLSTALLAATLAVGCGDDGAEDGIPTTPGVSPVVPGATGGAAQVPVAPGGTAGGQLTPTTPTTPVGPTTPTTPTTPTAPTAGAATPWCKVKAILDTKCIACHTTPSVGGAPFPLEKYADLTAASTKVAGKKIYERVGVRISAAKSTAENPAQAVMPPGAELPAADRAVIDSWIAAGAPQGDNATCAGTPGATTGGGGAQQNIVWPLPECDAVYKFTSHAANSQTAPYSVPPGQEIHPKISVPAPWGSEKVQAIAFKTITDKKAVLHHWILNGGGAFLTGWAPGEDGIKLMAPDVGMNMPSGNLVLDMHYNSLQVTTPTQDASGVEICVVKGAKVRKNAAAVTMGLVGIPIIPGNSTNFETKGTCTVGGSQPVTLLSASPHAHTYAVRMRFVLQRKSGETLVMHDQPFMFGEQKSFKLDPPVVVQPGDVITTSCFYNNKTSATVTFGEDTGNEMCFNFALYYPAGALSCGGGGALGGLGGLFGAGGL